MKASLILVAVLLPAASALAAPDLKRGETLLTRDCARCHAVGRTGENRTLLMDDDPGGSAAAKKRQRCWMD